LSETNKKAGGAKRAWPLLVGLPLILAVAVAAVLLSGGGERSQSPGQERPAEGEQPAGGGQEEAPREDVGLGHPSLGSADAPVVMIEYGDFQ
jgi:hypothetical protein